MSPLRGWFDRFSSTLFHRKISFPVATQSPKVARDEKDKRLIGTTKEAAEKVPLGAMCRWLKPARDEK
jgi:hypothetical protein